MQIIIPMSGFGERFRAAGYKTPKPLIEVDGKPIIQHVVDMFPGDHHFIFICNRDHLDDPSYRMRETLESLANSREIVAIEPHKLGPVHAVLQAIDKIDLRLPTIVNYADFTCRWDFAEFLSFIDLHKLDGAVPAYRGFHPHSGGSTNYAYIQEEGGRLTAIREKQPFTNDKTAEFASSGTYYFRTAQVMRDVFLKQVDANVSVNGEFYVSSAFDLLAKAGNKVGVFPLKHFMQWGTPQDLDDYLVYSELFRKLANLDDTTEGIKGVDSAIILSGGESKRFFDAGYLLPKALLSLNGTNLIEQALRQVPKKSYRSIIWLDTRLDAPISSLDLHEKFKLESTTSGQAETTHYALQLAECAPKGPITVLPNDSLTVDQSEGLNDLCRALSGDWMIVWATAPNPSARSTPEQFGWVWPEGEHGVRSSVKAIPDSEVAKVIIGTFTFSSPDLFECLFGELQRQALKVRDEFYIDSMIEVAQSLGVKVRIFEPEVFISLGTPKEYETYRYWQACFDQWAGHPYSLEKDPNVDPRNLEKLRLELSSTLHSPGEQG